MKLPVVLLHWLAIPIAGVFGYHAGGFSQPAEARDRPASHQVPSLSSTHPPLSPASRELAAWCLRLEKASAADLPGLYGEIMAIPGESGRYQPLRLLCARWVDIDPVGGWAFFTSSSKEDLGYPPRIHLLKEWVLVDLEAAFSAIKELGGEAPLLLEMVGSQLLREEPEMFWTWFRKARLPLPHDRLAAWTPLAGAHFEEMQAIATELLAADQSTTTTVIFHLLGTSIGTRDPEKALSWANAVPAAARNEALLGALRGLAASRPQLALENLKSLKDGTDDILRAACKTMMEQDPTSALALMQAHVGKINGMEYQIATHLANRLSSGLRTGRLSVSEAFEKAFAEIIRVPEEGNSVRTNVLLMRMWEGLPPAQAAGAAAWLKQQAQGGVRDAALTHLLYAWDRTDPQAARAFAAGLDNPSIEDTFYKFAGVPATAGFSISQEGMAELVAGFPPGYRATFAASGLLNYYDMRMTVFTEPFEGRTFAAALEDVPPSPSKEKAIGQISARWAREDPNSALEWAATQTEMSTRKAATGSAIEAWAAQDAWGASRWITQQPPGGTRDTAAQHLAKALSAEEPDSAWAWAGSIADPAIRLGAQSTVLRKWRDSAPAEASAAVQALSISLTPAQQHQLMDALSKTTEEP